MARRKIEGARAIVTGASSGIGREIALQLAQRGAQVLATARREDRLTELTEAAKELNGEIHSLAGDISDPTHRANLLTTVQDRFGGLDILVNNAGVGAIGEFLEADEARLRRVMEVNFFSPLELIRSAAPLLKAGRKPIITNVGSVLGHRAVPKKSEYCASKFALHGISDALRAEFAKYSIDVLLVSPSTTMSEFFDVADGEKSQLGWLKLGGVSSKYVARKTVSAIRSGKHEAILTIPGKLLVWADRLCPPIVNRLIARLA